MNQKCGRRCLLLASMLLSAFVLRAGGGALEIRQGYFWDPQLGESFVPRGMAYQTWNPPVGADQTFDQLRYDFLEFKKMHCNSVRCEMVWNQVERAPGEFHWERTDELVRVAEELGFKLFVLIGFQYAPDWFPKEWKALNEKGTNSVVVNYEHPETRRAYSNYIAQVTSRYRNSQAIGAWILGNEYAYFDLWTEAQEFLGYDPISVGRFQAFLAELYGGDIDALNTKWGVLGQGYTSFDQIPMPRVFSREQPRIRDLILWREQSIADYVAVGAVSARTHDPNHLLTYSMIGGIFTPLDAKYTGEDAPTIVRRCRAAGASLDFWAVNNYAWASFASELRAGDFGIRKLMAQSGLPVLLSETGHSSTDDFRFKAAGRQGDALAGQLWEALLSGAIGVHLFTWNDREIFADYFLTERGFGMANQDRTPKIPGFTNVVRAFRRMAELPLEKLLVGSSNAPPQAQVFWGDSSKVGWSRANMENAMLWTALRRAGYSLAMLDDAGFARGDYTNAPVLVLSRCFQMEPAQLDQLVPAVATHGIHLHANADLPGQFNSYHQPNPGWASVMGALFGLRVAAGIRPGWDSGATNFAYRSLRFRVNETLGRLTNGAVSEVKTWKIWHGMSTIGSDATRTLVTHTGMDQTQGAQPALQLTTLGSGRTAVNTFALGDLELNTSGVETHDWDFRYDWFRTIYSNHFGLRPSIEIQGAEGSYVIPDYRICPNGSLLVGLLNGKPVQVSVTVVAPALFAGRTVEDLTRGGVLEVHSDGSVPLTLEPDGYVWWHVYARTGSLDGSIVNTNANKLWFGDVPAAVWPRDPGYSVPVVYDTVEPVSVSVAFERVSYPPRVYAETTFGPVTGRGTNLPAVTLPGPNAGDATYRSSAEDETVRYVWRARLLQGGQTVAERRLPVRLLWGVRPVTTLPTPSPAGGRVEATLEWQELPSYEPAWAGLPLSRARQWAEHLAARQHYAVTLELVDSQARAVAQGYVLTREGSGQARVAVEVPPGLTGPLSWRAYLRPSPGVSADLLDGFENRGPGVVTDEQRGQLGHFAWTPLPPWVSYVYSETVEPITNAARFLDPSGGGVGTPPGRFMGEQRAFVVVTNPPTAGAYSGFGIVLRDDYWPEWSLPADTAEWTNYTMSARVLVRDEQTNVLQTLPCRVELQVKDAMNHMLHFVTPYQPGPDGWMEVKASLDQFGIFVPDPMNEYRTNWFHSARVKSLAVNVQMTNAAIHTGFFDDVRFEGPERRPPAWSSLNLHESFEDRPLGVTRGGLNLAAPWTGYMYPGADRRGPVYVVSGIHSNAFSEGFISTFFVLSNRVDAPDASGFGYYYNFPAAWSLPADTNLWAQYTFSFDFLEKRRHPCSLQLQIKSSPKDWIEFAKPYEPGPDGWDRATAGLHQFRRSAASGSFDWRRANALAVNVKMDRKGVTYDTAFDRFVFDGPETLLAPETGVAVFRSDAVSRWPDRDGDGILDAHETGTGIFAGAQDTGTDPASWDTDGDGMGDGHELVAGTDPNRVSDVAAITSVDWISPTEVRVTMPVRAGRLYTLQVTDEESLGRGEFWVVPEYVRVPAGDSVWTAIDHPPAGSDTRYYRIAIEQAP